jgi:hypothetical protein
VTTVEAPPMAFPDEMRAFASLNDDPRFRLLREKFEQMRLEEEAGIGRNLTRGGGFDAEYYATRTGFWSGISYLFNATDAAKKQLLREQKKENQ